MTQPPLGSCERATFTFKSSCTLLFFAYKCKSIVARQPTIEASDTQTTSNTAVQKRCY